MRENGILRVITRLLIPLIMLFALYIQFHGDYSPGGGFQAGVMFAAAWILFVLIYGLEAGLAVIPERVMFVLSAAGALLYAAVGLLGVVLGGRFLDYAPLLENPQSAQQAGIILVEFGVGVTVASVVMLIFSLFARRRGEQDESWQPEVDD
ncbi:MAG: cation:proton antiporter [Gammaproteobacteria bacterium HGW-Gammaproteobacteria-8]|nr:MAG: cation:proton antiporter [Gammaproteobacteria bacterium HGW-Gammaproteobacteria-8]